MNNVKSGENPEYEAPKAGGQSVYITRRDLKDLTTATTPLRRFCFALDLKDDPELIERYRWWHRPGGPPAAVTRGLRAADIREMEIWLCGSRMFMLLEAGPNYDPAAKAARDAQDPDVLAWEQLMWQLQQPLPAAAPGEKWAPAERIFALSAQP